MSGYLKADDATISGNGFPTLLNFTAPDFSAGLLSGMVGQYVIDSSIGEAALLENMVNPSLPLLKIGAPVAIGPGMTLSQADGFDTQIPETAQMSVAIVSKRTTAKSLAVYAGVRGGAITDGFGMFCDGTPPDLSWRCGGKNGSGTYQNANSGNTTAAPSDWMTVIGAIGADGVVCGVGYSDTYSEGSSAFTGRTWLAGNLFLGGIGNAIYTAANDAAFMLIWDRKLSPAERLEVADTLRNFFAKVGIETL